MRFEIGGKGQSVSVSGRRTKVTIKGKRAERSEVKTGHGLRRDLSW